MDKTLLHRLILRLSILLAVLVGILFFVEKTRVHTQLLPILEPIQEKVITLIATSTTPVKKQSFRYIEIMDACGPSLVGSCVNMRSGTSEESRVVKRLRTGIVLQVSEIVISHEREWYKIQPDTDIKFPERVEGDWFVAAGDYIRLFQDEGTQEISPRVHASSTKRIIVNLSEQTLYAYNGDELFMKELISTGLDITPTPQGTFSIFRKTPSRYMQGPLENVSNQYYDLPGVPWNLYFTTDGAVIHGTYWHNHFGEPWSHGCVNLPLEAAKKLYEWADLGIPVIIKK